MQKTPMPTVAGILAIAAGGFKLLGLLGLIIASFFVIASPVPAVGVDPAVILLIISIPLAILGILAVVGGIYALQRKKWGLALAGSIAAFLPFSLMGIAALILTVLSKNEFE